MAITGEASHASSVIPAAAEAMHRPDERQAVHPFIQRHLVSYRISLADFIPSVKSQMVLLAIYPSIFFRCTPLGAASLEASIHRILYYILLHLDFNYLYC
jgi:hypothetical protein